MSRNISKYLNFRGKSLGAVLLKEHDNGNQAKVKDLLLLLPNLTTCDFFCTRY